MKAKPAATRGTVHAETGKPPVKASKPTTAPATKAETVEKVIKARAAAIGIDPKKVIVGFVGAKPAAKSDGKPAEKPKPAAPVPSFSPPVTKLTPPKMTPAPAKPAAQAPKPAEAKKPEAKPAETWPKMIARHAVELRKLNASDKPHNGPDVRFLSGVYVPAENATAYREAMTRHANERAALRDNPTTARAVFEWALTEYKGDEALALYALGVMFTADPAGIVAPALRRVRALAEVWRDALAAVKPDAVSKIVTVRALGPKPKPAEKKPATAPAKPATDAKKPADKPAKPAAKPVEVEKPKGMGMVAKIEAKADAKPAKAKPKK